jgi:general secretion pathway protein D
MRKSMFALAMSLALAAPLAQAQDAAGGPPGAPAQNTLNIKDADIRTLIATVSEITGKNFIVDPRVEGKVNVVSARPMDADEVYEVFESVLRVHGFALVPAGNMVKIVPEAIAMQDGSLTASTNGPDAITSRVIALRHVAAKDLLPVLQPLKPQSAQLMASPSGNAIVVIDRAANVARIENLIRRIDTENENGVEVIPLSHASASEVANTLVRLVPDNNGGGKAVADARTNSILLSGDQAARLKLRALVSHLDTPLENDDATQVVYLRYAKASELAPVLENVASTLNGTNGKADAVKIATIQPHGETNALIITAAPAVFRELQSVIRSLDGRPAQVLIEAIIAEVSDEAAAEIGIQWQATDGLAGEEGLIGGTNFPGANGAGSIVGAIANPLGAIGGGLNLGYVTGTTQIPIPGENGRMQTVYEIGALAKLLKGDGRTNILSEPSIVTLDNKEAVIKVGQEVPFLTGQYTNTGTGGTSQPSNPFQTVERKDVGIELKVTPHINEGDEVALDISQIVSSLAPTPDGATDLVTNKREINTSVLVRDGGMLVLGGLTTTEVTESVSKVPALGDIPLLGNLFKFRKSNVLKRNLMVFLRPVILRDANAESIISQKKYSFLRSEQLQVRERAGNLVRDEDQPLLPELSAPAPIKEPEAQ